MATPPSPTITSPSLTQSTSNSNSTSTPSTSPPQPTTPPRSSRSRTRYPDLGRVPLHRRGTSKTYERLEDLLREAGYKETRVFTPEGERGEGSAQQDTQSSDQGGGVKNSVGAFVGFLAGLMPNATASRSTSSLGLKPDEGRAYSPPVSPLAQRQSQKQKERQETVSLSESHSPSYMTSSIESLEPTPRANRRRPPSRSRSHTPLPPPSIYSHSQSSQQDLQRPKHLLVHRATDQYSYTSSRRPPIQSHTSQTSLLHHSSNNMSSLSHPHIAQPQPSRAGAYLRHMASAPNMPKRPKSTPTHNKQRRKTLFLNDSDTDSKNDYDAGPPLPPTWLESVARAVLFGGMAAYIGGPSIVDPPPPLQPQSPVARPKTLRSTRSSISQISSHQRTKHLSRPHASPRSGLWDRTNKGKGLSVSSVGGLLAPPQLFAQIERGRAGTSASEVSRIRVVCRSAPTSRASSVVRGGGGDVGKEKRDRVRSGKEREHARRRGRGRTAERDRLPSLANTRTEGDGWVGGKRKKTIGAGQGQGQGNRYLSGWGVEAESSDEGGYEGLSSSEEEGELDLAKMLVNPKRQHSIKSLRKHLAAPMNEGASASSKLMKAAGMTAARGSRSGSVRQSIREDPDWDGSEAEEWGRGWVQKSARRRNSEEDDDDESFAEFFGEGRGEGLGRSGGGGRIFGSGRSGTGGSRLGIPGPWGLIGGGS
ncbi:hypothetical protein D9615_006102 [Tricholomella constricta]|uniref:Uncharacterized protein n=1 Tax=Tricholomella constricta TaxID=117010 RepID=A0A8H5HBC9_9AGAR|nr:hypothetical protein D9615_006102 [Tricholomella constricta]